jgi:hypothetical protein
MRDAGLDKQSSFHERPHHGYAHRTEKALEKATRNFTPSEKKGECPPAGKGEAENLRADQDGRPEHSRRLYPQDPRRPSLVTHEHIHFRFPAIPFSICEKQMPAT